MAELDFPSNPTLNQEYTHESVTWIATHVAPNPVRWQRKGASVGSIGDAPIDGQDYNRKDGSWAEAIDADDLALKANIVDPIFTGTPKAPTPDDNSQPTALATTDFVTQALAGVGTTPTVSVFTASGTWVAPANLKAVQVICSAGGGGGGGGSSSGGGYAQASYTNGAGGGGAGGTAGVRIAEENLVYDAPGEVNITIGAGGGGGAVNGGNGGAGAGSTFGSNCSASAGSGGQGPSTSTDTSTYGGAGGNGSGGNINIYGGSGSTGQGGGVSGDEHGGPYGSSGSGGASFWGGGGRGGAVNAAGQAGLAYSSGGGGGMGNAVGGAGKSGVIYIVEYY